MGCTYNKKMGLGNCRLSSYVYHLGESSMPVYPWPRERQGPALPIPSSSYCVTLLCSGLLVGLSEQLQRIRLQLLWAQLLQRRRILPLVDDCALGPRQSPVLRRR